MRAPLRRSRGFTLIELLVSLTAGLVIAIAVAGLSKMATTTFYEESRVQAAELTLRVAAERLRSDLSRAAYMGTPNVLADPLVVLQSGNTAASQFTAYPNGLGLLAGVRYVPNSVAADDPNQNIATMSTRELGAIPDRLILGGNMTTADEYIVQSVLAGGTCGGSAVTLSLDSPAISRLVRDPATGLMLGNDVATAALNAAFAPVATSGGAGLQYMARIVDDSGKRQFVALCPSPAAMVGGAPVISVHPNTPVLSSTNTGAQGGVSGFGVGRLTINPVHLVEWSVRDRTAAAAPAWGRDQGPDVGTRFDLVREFLDAFGTRVGAPELVAEYIVDFEIGLVVESSSPAASPRMQLAPFDATGLALVTQNMTPTAATTTGPQWIRSLRYRLAARAPMADRTVTITRPPGTGYAYRYCADAAGCGTSQRWARVRTLTGEVTLQNQARYP